MRSFLIALLLGLFLCSCSGAVKSAPAAAAKPRVLSSTAMIGNLVDSIAENSVDHEVLILGDIDPHSYELVKGDDEKIDRAALVFFNGLGLEHGASLQSKLKRHPNAIPLGDVLYLSGPSEFLKVDGQLDPHIWMDVHLWAKTIPLIVEQLKKVMPENAALFEENGKKLEEKLMRLDGSLLTQFEKIPPESRYLVTSHDAFNYFARRYLAAPGESEAQWQKRFQAPEGLAPESQISITDIGRIIDHIVSYRIYVVFPESNLSRDALKKIISVCGKKGHKVVLAEEALYGDTMGSLDSKAGSYFEMMSHNGEIIARYLTEGKNSRQ